MKTIVDTNKGLVANLNDQIKEKDTKINELDDKVQKLNCVMEEYKEKAKEDMEDESRQEDVDKLRYEWEVDMAHLEKEKQDQGHQLFLAQEEIVKIGETWDADKVRMMDYENKYCQAQIAMTDLAGKVQAAEAQLTQSRALREISSGTTVDGNATHHVTHCPQPNAVHYQQPSVEQRDNQPSHKPHQVDENPSECVFLSCWKRGNAEGKVPVSLATQCYHT